MLRRTLVLTFVAATLLAACGGDDDGGGGSNSAYCKQLRDSASEAAKPTTTRSGPSTTANYADLRGKFDDALEKISSKAPKELDDDYKVVKDYFDTYLGALGQTTPDTSKLTAMQEDYRKAQEAIVKYNREECGFDQTATSVGPSGATTATTAK